MCDCAPLEESLAHIDRVIESGQVFFQAVTGGPANRPWTYSIGITELFGHPELLMVGACMDCAYVQLTGLVDEIRHGTVMEPGMQVGEDMRVRAVHPSHWRTDRFGMWLTHYRTKPWDPPPMEAVQILFADEEGRFPGEPGCTTAASQGRLHLPALPTSRQARRSVHVHRASRRRRRGRR